MRQQWISLLSSKGVLYWKTIAMAVLLTCLPLTVISAAYLYIGNQHMVNQFQQKNEDTLQDAAKQIDEQFSQLVQYALNMVVKPHFKPSVSDMDFGLQFEETLQLLDTLTLIENADPLIDQVYLYVQKQNKVLQPSLGLRTLEDTQDAERWGRLLQEEKGIYWVHDLVRPFAKGGAPHAIVLKLPFNGSTSFGAIVIYINPSKLHIFANTDNLSYVLNAEGHVIGHSAKTAEHPEALPLILEHLQEETAPAEPGRLPPPRTWQMPIEGGDSLLVNTVSFEKMGGTWTYIAGTPLSVITAPTRPYTHVVLVLWGFALLAALALSWFASRRMYRPIRRVVTMLGGWRTPESAVHNELDYIEKEWKQYRFANETLQSRLDQSIPSVREAFINQFVTGQALHLTEREIREKLRLLQVNIEGKRFAAVVVQPHALGDGREPFSDRDEHLMAFAAINIVQELSEQAADYVHLINFLDSSFGAVLILPGAEPDESRSRIEQLCAQCLRALRDMLRSEATIVVSGPTSSWLDVPYALEQARRALRHRTFDSGSQLLEAEHVLSQTAGNVEFPLELEQDIIHALNMGLEEEAVQGVEQFVTALHVGGAAEWLIHQALMRLVSNIHRAMLQAGHNPYAVFDAASLQEELNGLRDTRACLTWFHTRIIRPYIASLNKSYNAAMKRLVEEMLERIGHDYMSDLSLDIVAAEAGVSASQLSKAFKQMTGSNYVDYLTSIKMNKCKELLLSTDMKINEIAEAVGYQPSYFNRMFKKLEGMTPGQYRQQHAG